jgi:hypothetical protein
MDSDSFKELREKTRLSKLQRQDINSVAIENWCEGKPVELLSITDYQLRLQKGKQRIDIYPQSKKYHDLKLNIRGQIKGKISDFLSKHFGL